MRLCRRATLRPSAPPARRPPGPLLLKAWIKSLSAKLSALRRAAVRPLQLRDVRIMRLIRELSAEDVGLILVHRCQHDARDSDPRDQQVLHVGHGRSLPLQRVDTSVDDVVQVEDLQPRQTGAAFGLDTHLAGIALGLDLREQLRVVS